MTYTLLTNTPDMGYYAICKTESTYKILYWSGKKPAISKVGMSELVSILNECNPTDVDTETVCRIILGKQTEIGSA